MSLDRLLINMVKYAQYLGKLIGYLQIKVC